MKKPLSELDVCLRLVRLKVRICSLMAMACNLNCSEVAKPLRQAERLVQSRLERLETYRRVTNPRHG